MNFRKLCLVAALGATTACGGANAGPLVPGGSGGSGGTGGAGGMIEPPPVDQSIFRVGCVFGELELDVPIELVVELSEPYSNSHSIEATFSSTVVLTEEAVAALIDATITVIDIVSISVTSGVIGATPTMMSASLGAAPINDFDLEADPNDDGTPGPFRFELDPMAASSIAESDAREVIFGLDFSGISIVLGDFSIPASCLNRSLVGVPVSFPVDR